MANRVDIDVDHVALGGVSDGAGYALSMGLAYGDAFNHVIVLAGGQMVPFRRQGKPRLFFAHGTEDIQIPIDETARKYVPQLKAEGYDVTYHEYLVAIVFRRPRFAQPSSGSSAAIRSRGSRSRG